MKHEGMKKAKKDLPKFNIKKGKWYNSKFCKHKESQALFSAKTPITISQQVNKNPHLELEKNTF
jgi:hypothetical protein